MQFWKRTAVQTESARPSFLTRQAVHTGLPARQLFDACTRHRDAWKALSHKRSIEKYEPFRQQKHFASPTIHQTEAWSNRGLAKANLAEAVFLLLCFFSRFVSSLALCLIWLCFFSCFGASLAFCFFSCLLSCLALFLLLLWYLSCFVSSLSLLLLLLCSFAK